MRQVAICFSVGADARKLVIDRDTVLSYAWSNALALVSLDPSDNYASSLKVPADRISESLLAVFGNSGTATTPAPTQVNVNFPLQEGSALFVSCNSAGIVLLCFSDPT